MKGSKYKEKTFYQKIKDAMGTRLFSAFEAFPKGVYFNGQENDEEVILVVRYHPVIFLPRLILGLGIMMLTLIGFMFLSFLNLDQLTMRIFFIGGFVFLLTFVLTLAFSSFVKWYYNVNIITNQRIIDVDFNSIISHDVVETQLEKVEDIYHESSGFLSSFLDYGNIFIQTAGAETKFDMYNVPRPADIQDTIFDLLELKQNGQ